MGQHSGASSLVAGCLSLAYCRVVCCSPNTASSTATHTIGSSQPPPSPTPSLPIPPISPTPPIHPIKPNVPCVAVPQQHKSHRAQAISLTLRSVGGLYGRQQSSCHSKSQLGNSNMRCKHFLSHWSLTISF